MHAPTIVNSNVFHKFVCTSYINTFFPPILSRKSVSRSYLNPFCCLILLPDFAIVRYSLHKNYKRSVNFTTLMHFIYARRLTDISQKTYPFLTPTVSHFFYLTAVLPHLKLRMKTIFVYDKLQKKNCSS